MSSSSHLYIPPQTYTFPLTTPENRYGVDVIYYQYVLTKIGKKIATSPHCCYFTFIKQLKSINEAVSQIKKLDLRNLKHRIAELEDTWRHTLTLLQEKSAGSLVPRIKELAANLNKKSSFALICQFEEMEDSFSKLEKEITALSEVTSPVLKDNILSAQLELGATKTTLLQKRLKPYLEDNLKTCDQVIKISFQSLLQHISTSKVGVLSLSSKPQPIKN
ncbi:MAG TPA: hypothetical protein VGJ00_05755 [Rhabdochlamydiaceae bacterium]|jgi:hypothetical protein